MGAILTSRIRHRIIRRMLGIEINDAISATGQTIERHNPSSPVALQRLAENVVCHSEDIDTINRELKNFLYAELYRHHRVVRMAVKAERLLSQLFETYIAEPAQLPPTVQKAIEERGLYRAVTDHIAGMTDRYALEEWERLFDPFTRP